MNLHLCTFTENTKQNKQMFSLLSSFYLVHLIDLDHQVIHLWE